MKKHSILFGNGITRLSPNCPSWSQLLQSLNHEEFEDSLKKSLEELPYTFQYEIFLPDTEYLKAEIIHNNKSLSFNEKTPIYNIHAELNRKQSIANALYDIRSNKIYDSLSRLDVDNYITTNYDYTLINTFRQKEIFDIETDSAESVYSLRRRKRVYIKGEDTHVCNVWYIHGEIEEPQTIMLGLDHYCGSIGKIDSYIKGNYDHNKEKRASVKDRILTGTCDDHVSWIDLLFYTDIHIVGLSLDYSETDLWWILNKRTRVYKELTNIARNKLFFYSNDILPEKKYLLEKFGVTCIDIPLDDNNYEKSYEDILYRLEKIIGWRS